MDTQMYLYNGAGLQIGYNDDGVRCSVSGASYIATDLDTGTYTVSVKGCACPPPPHTHTHQARAVIYLVPHAYRVLIGACKSNGMPNSRPQVRRCCRRI